MTSSLPARATDAFTKGGQIFGHVWRMRWQNIKLLLSFGTLGFGLGILWGALVWKTASWEFWHLYSVGYWGGHLKVLLWPLWKTFLLSGDGFLKALLPGSKGIPTAFQTAAQLKTSFFWEGKVCQLPTLLFLKHPHLLSVIWRGHLTVLTGGTGAVLMMGACASVFKRKSQKLEEKKILEGNTLVSEDMLERLLKKKKKASSLKLTPQLSLAEGTEVEHLMVCGTTRMGKTSTLIHLLSQIRQAGQKAVVLDLTGEFTALFFREGVDVLLNPLDTRSARWRVWDEGLREEEREAWASCVVPSHGAASDPFWAQAACKLLSETTRLLAKKRGSFHTKSAQMQDILNWSCTQPLAAVQPFYEHSSLAPLMHPAAEKTASGVRMHLANAIHAFSYLRPPQERGFSVLEWVGETEDSWLFLTALPSQRQALSPLLASWCALAFLGLERLGPCFERRVWFIVDEFPGLNQPLASLPRMVAEGAKYGACCVLSFQNKAQLDHLYTPAVTRTLLANCNTKVIFRSPEPETARALSQLLGQQEISLTTESLSMGAHHLRDGVGIATQQRQKPLVSESDLMMLEKFEAFVKLAGNWPVARAKTQPSSLPSLAPSFIPHASP